MISIFPYSPKALLVQWDGGINKNTMTEISQFNTIILDSGMDAITETIPAFTSITICYRDILFTDIKAKLEKLYTQLNTNNTHLDSHKWQLPILLVEKLSKEITSQTALNKSQIFEAFLTTVFTIGMKGFLPGFIYLAGLPEALSIPRKSTPDQSIQKGSVAIGGAQCGIYPTVSPGGWHILGNCPIPLIDLKDQNLSCFKIGDEIQFTAIETKEHAILANTDWTLPLITSKYRLS